MAIFFGNLRLKYMRKERLTLFAIIFDRIDLAVLILYNCSNHYTNRIVCFVSPSMRQLCACVRVQHREAFGATFLSKVASPEGSKPGEGSLCRNGSEEHRVSWCRDSTKRTRSVSNVSPSRPVNSLGASTIHIYALSA